MKNTELLERFNERINQVAECCYKDREGNRVNFDAWLAFDDAKRILADIVKYEDIVSEEDDLK